MKSKSTETPPLSSATKFAKPGNIFNQQATDFYHIPLSTSVEKAVKLLRHKGKISAWDFAKQLLQDHPRYAGGMAGRFSKEKGPPSTELKLVQEWMETLQRLFNKE